ncbi:DGPF domain protein [Burkholderia mallei PRL-20]|uniref:DGPF domain protein n=1 Tax=Burkholderia mallei (strain NCTC 10229) TaxID=412022 RepID=A2RWL2_BURM9|nr:DGPF domain protein [Burkholderia mallei NCTC 10229]EDS82943.1 DGPF domain protein [Burkholderia pseudomallei S13]EES43475.1 DGPF domain protein [Burkholderia mallei PRL-20]
MVGFRFCEISPDYGTRAGPGATIGGVSRCAAANARAAGSRRTRPRRRQRAPPRAAGCFFARTCRIRRRSVVEMSWPPDGAGPDPAAARLDSSTRGGSKMRVMVMVKATNESEAGKLPTREQFEAMGRFNEALVKAGVILAADGLHPSAKGKRVRFSGSARSVIDGPFAQTGELVAGFWLWKVASMDEAVEWVKRCPNPMESDSEIEIRPLYELEDFGDAFTPELREREARLRDEIDEQGKKAP